LDPDESRSFTGFPKGSAGPFAFAGPVWFLRRPEVAAREDERRTKSGTSRKTQSGRQRRPTIRQTQSSPAEKSECEANQVLWNAGSEGEPQGIQAAKSQFVGSAQHREAVTLFPAAKTPDAEQKPR
jgi:hypothetical protein